MASSGQPGYPLIVASSREKKTVGWPTTRVSVNNRFEREEE
jgi:hypothetical protein